MRPVRPTPCAAAPILFDSGVAVTDRQVETLRGLCHACPVQPECYLVAVSTPVRDLAGFMAGLTETQRHAARRQAVAA